MAEDFAVVRFIEKNEFSEILSNWLIDVDEFEEGSCKRPPPIIKNVNYFLKSRYPPKDDWPTYKVEVLRYCETLDKARKVASDADYTSTEEIHQGRGRRIKRPKLLTDSDTSDGGEVIKNGKKIPPASNIPKMYKSNVTIDNTCAPLTGKQLKKARDDSLPSTSFGNNSQCRTDIENDDSDSTITGKSPEKSNFDDPPRGELSTPSLHDEHRKREERLSLIRMRQLSKSPLVISNDDDIARRLQLLEEKSDTALNLLGKVVVGIKDIQQHQLALKSSNDHVAKNTNKKDLQTIKDALPLETKEAIKDFENLLSKPHYYREFTLMIQQIGGSDGKEYTERIFTKLFSPFFAKSNTWDGKVTKHPVKDLTLMNIIEEMILSKFPFWSSAEFEKVASNWLRLGNQRTGQQPAQQKKKDATKSSTNRSED